MTKYDGGPAFPFPNSYQYHEPHYGMSLRDWFAGQALVGLLGNDTPISDTGSLEVTVKLLASGAYAVADAMLKEKAMRKIKPTG